MRTLLIFVCVAASLLANAFEIDSLERAKLVQEGRTELCNLIEYNAHVLSPADRKYLVMIDGDPNAINYTVEKNVQGNTEDILTQETVDSINAILARTYADYGIEMYIIMMKSFNFVVKAPLPNLPSATQLFTQHLYDEESNINELRILHQQLTDEITSSTFSARGRDCLVYSRADYKGIYAPGKTGTWTLSKRIPFRAQTPTYPKLTELTDYYYDRIKNNPDVIEGGLQYSLRCAAKEFFESAKFMALKSRILTTFDNDSMSSILAQFNEQVDYLNLTERERVHALAVFAGFSMSDNLNSSEERYACRIIEGTPSEQVNDFFEDLSAVSPLNTNPAYHGAKLNVALIVTLIGRIDDAGGGGDNYTRMMRGLTTLAMSSESYAAAHMPTTSQQWLDRRIYWDDWSVMETAPIGTHDYDVTLGDDAKVHVNHKVVKRWDSDTAGRQESIRYTEVWEQYDPYALEPFDLVVFTNRSSLGMLQVAGAAPDQPFLAPAIFLKYADDKAFNTNAITVTAIAIDVAAIASGPFAILGALTAGNVALAAYEGLQLLGSVANLAANQNATPEFQEAITAFNMVVGGWGLAQIVVSGTKFVVGYMDAALNGTIRPVPIATATDYCTKYDAITSWNGVDDVTKGKMARLRKVLGEEVNSGNAIVAQLEVIAKRSSFWDEWVNKCFPSRNWNATTFNTSGINYSSFKSSNPAIDAEMRTLYNTASDAEKYLPGLVESGSTNPTRVVANEGDVYYKIVPKGGNINTPSPYYLSEAELQMIKLNPALIEQKLGLPLGSTASEYDVFSLTSLSDNNILFASTVAPTRQFANATPHIVYSTPGGATQSLIINNNNVNLWRKSTSPVETITPNTLPQIQN